MAAGCPSLTAPGGLRMRMDHGRMENPRAAQRQAGHDGAASCAKDLAQEPGLVLTLHACALRAAQR